MLVLQRFDAPGLPADWLNAWLAAIGVVSLLPDVRLSWTEEFVPHAVFWAPNRQDLPAAIGNQLPSVANLKSSAIARSRPNTADFPRNVSLEAFKERAEIERRSAGFLLSATVSDMGSRDSDAEVSHGPFDPPAPRGETLFSRALKCRELIDGEVCEAVVRTLEGRSAPVQTNGLGFDCRRLSTGVQASGASSKVHVHPVIELLALEALRIFPVRGNGRRAQQRGWSGPPSRRGAFRWYTWLPQLDLWAIDALLDSPDSVSTHVWQSVPYQTSSSDTTRAYFSEQVR